MSTLEVRLASEINGIFAKVEKPRHRKVRFPRASRKPVIVERWWA